MVGRRVFVGSGDGRLYQLDLKTGALGWQYAAGGSLLASPAVAAGRLVIGTDEGDLYCFGERSRELRVRSGTMRAGRFSGQQQREQVQRPLM